MKEPRIKSLDGKQCSKDHFKSFGYIHNKLYLDMFQT